MVENRTEYSIDLRNPEKGIQALFDGVGQRIGDAENVIKAQFEIQKLLLRFLLDQGALTLPALEKALKQLSASFDDEISKEMMQGIVDSLRRSHGEKPSDPHLRLVQAIDEKTDQDPTHSAD